MLYFVKASEKIRESDAETETKALLVNMPIEFVLYP